jgi:hypothetical protein
MEDLIRRAIKRPKEKTAWPNPRESIGDLVGTLPDGKGSYWTAKGPARDVWKYLGRKVRNCIAEDGACKPGPEVLIVEIYMVGASEDTAVPQIWIDSDQEKALKQILKAIDESGLMKQQHPAIGLVQWPDLAKPKPKLLSQDEIESNFIPNSNIGNGTEVLTPPQDKPFGRRLFIPKQDGISFRPATAGPILYINGKIYQLTVGHAFVESADDPLPDARLGDLELGGIAHQKEIEDDNHGIQHRLTGESCLVVKGACIGDIARSRVRNSSSSAPQCSPMTGITRQSSPDSGVCLARDDVSAANDRIVPRKLDSLGKLAWRSDTSNSNSPDYALVELEKAYFQGSNEVPCQPNGSQRFLQVRRSAEDGPRDVNVITMTSSSGFMTGKLCATASYVRFPNQRSLQELYPVLLDGKLADGDCGSGVVDRATGLLYGHIVAGTAGTGLAYIVPVGDVFQDIKEKMGGDVSLIPPGHILKPPPKEDFKMSNIFKSEYSERGDPLRVVEFASDGYFKKLKQQAHAHKIEEEEKAVLVPTKPAASIECQVAGPSRGRSIIREQPIAQNQFDTKRGDISLPTTRPLPQDSTLKSRLWTAIKETKGKGKENPHPFEYKKSKNMPFEENFFALPVELRDQVIAYLGVPDFLNLKLVSKSWHELVSVNETSISRAFLEYNPIPRFVVSLYPIPADLDLQYIYGLWRRLSMTSKLSRLMADWITTDMFLRKGETQREFLPQQTRIRRRLIPILFTLSHFFEAYRHLHLHHLLENDHPLLPEGCKINPVERKIMNMYDNKTLLQVHQVFPFVLSYLKRKLRPPSYFGRLEKSLYGYVRSPVPEHVHASILCIGGLREMTKILKIENYDDRRVAVDDWYSTVFQQPIDYTPETHRWSLVFGQKKPKQSSSGTAAGGARNTTSASTSNRPHTAQGAEHNNAKDIKGKGKQTTNTTSSSSASIEPISAEHARLLLQDLPTLEQIWIPTSEALLLAWRVVERSQDIKRKGQAMHELIVEEFTAADELFYGCSEQDFNRDSTWLGWGNLFDDDVHERGS